MEQYSSQKRSEDKEDKNGDSSFTKERYSTRGAKICASSSNLMYVVLLLFSDKVLSIEAVSCSTTLCYFPIYCLYIFPIYFSIVFLEADFLRLKTLLPS